MYFQNGSYRPESERQRSYCSGYSSNESEKNTFVRGVKALAGIIIHKLDEIFSELPWRERNENLANKSKDFSHIEKNQKGE
jgi:hypothetical protein